MKINDIFNNTIRPHVTVKLTLFFIIFSFDLKNFNIKNESND